MVMEERCWVRCPVLLFFIGGLLALPKDLKLWRLVVAGLLFGLSVATKPFFLIVLPAVLLGEWYRHSLNTKVFWQRTSVIFGMAIVPIVLWLRTILPDVSVSGLLTTGHYYSNSYADSNFIGQVIENLRRFYYGKHANPLIISNSGYWFRNSYGAEASPVTGRN